MVFLDLEEDPSVLQRQSLPPPDSLVPNASGLPASPDLGSPEIAEYYGANLLKHLSREISEDSLSKLTVLIAFVHPDREARSQGVLLAQRLSRAVEPPGEDVSNGAVEQKRSVLTPTRIITYLQDGAADVVPGPFVKARLDALASYAYRAHIEGRRSQGAFIKARRMRKRSWIGVYEEKPYAYMRESMYVTVCDCLGAACLLPLSSHSLTLPRFQPLSSQAASTMDPPNEPHRVSSLLRSICSPEETLTSVQERYVA